MRKLRQFLKGRRELFITYDVNKLSIIINILRENNIEFYIFSKYTGLGDRMSGSWWSFFENSELGTQYYIYVPKNEYITAKYLIQEIYKEV